MTLPNYRLTSIQSSNGSTKTTRNSTLTNLNVLNMGETRTLSAFPITQIKITSSYRRKDNGKDLRVLMSSDRSFSDHIDIISNTVKNISSWILRTFKTSSITPILTLLYRQYCHKRSILVNSGYHRKKAI